MWTLPEYWLAVTSQKQPIGTDTLPAGLTLSQALFSALSQTSSVGSEAQVVWGIERKVCLSNQPSAICRRHGIGTWSSQHLCKPPCALSSAVWRGSLGYGGHLAQSSLGDSWWLLPLLAYHLLLSFSSTSMRGSARHRLVLSMSVLVSTCLWLHRFVLNFCLERAEA